MTLLASEQQVLAIFAVTDTIKGKALGKASCIGFGVISVMLTGEQCNAIAPSQNRRVSTTRAATCRPRTNWRLSEDRKAPLRARRP